MPHHDSEDYKAQAILKWEETHKNVAAPPQDVATLQQLLKEAQIAQLALLIEREQLKKKGRTYSPDDAAALRLLLAALPKAVFIKDIQDDYRILFWNGVTSEFMGTVVQEAIGKTDYELFSKDIATVIRRLDRQAAEESLQQTATTYTTESTFYGIQRSIIKDVAGEPLFLVGTLMNSIPYLEKEHSLLNQKTAALNQKQEQHLSNQRVEDFNYTLHQTTLVLVLNQKEEIIAVNQKFCDVSGFQEEEVLGKTYGSLGDKQLNEDLWAAMHTALQQGKMWQGEVQEQNKDNCIYWTYTSIVPFLDEAGKPYQYIITQADITNRKHLEEKLREAKKEADKNAKIKEDFLANMSHEIRTPMNGVLGFSRLLLQTNMTHIQHEYAQSIYSSAENLLVIVNDILDVSKIESGTFQLNETPFNLKKRIEEGLSILKVSVQKKKLAFNIHIDPTIPTIILGVPDRLSQVLINLVGNAIKFTKKGTIVLSVTLYNNRLLFKVTDTGIGIPEDKLETIFESFTQAENYTTRAYSGTGLGLSISKKLVNVMGGQIGVESKLGHGSTFFFSLPFKMAVEEAMDTLSNPSNTIAFPRADVPLILVVEDNKVNQELVLIYLNLLECACHVVENGLEALSYIRKFQYDLILMDVQMPKMDGMAATSAIRKEHTNVPIIAMSAHALEREKQRCFEIGMNDYISKPFKVEALQEIMAKHIKLPSQKEQSAVPRIQHLDNNSTPPQPIKPVFLSNYTNVRISRELLILFKDELLKLVNNMQEAFRTGDIERIQRQMHRIKPNFELFDLVQFYEWSDEMDVLAANKAPIAQIRAIYEELEKALPLLMERIEEEVQ